MKILNTILTLGCLSGLVSCYPIDAQSANAANSNKKTVSANNPATNVAKKKVNSTAQNTKKKISKKVNSSTDYNDSVDEATSAVEKKVEATKPAVPAAAKTASKVPGKEGFVFNPYTHNQVDVRGIPSGTKVRDPHDANPAHIFRVP